MSILLCPVDPSAANLSLKPAVCERGSTQTLERRELVEALPKDKYGNIVRVGARVRLLGLSGKWPQEEQRDVLSMIGETFEIEEIDEYGHPWVRKAWPNEGEGICHSHSIAVEPHEIELVAVPAL
jgi:hypothetical protein